MRVNRLPLTAGLAFSIYFLPSALAQTNLVLNGGFEADGEDYTFISDWSSQDPFSNGYWTIYDASDSIVGNIPLVDVGSYSIYGSGYTTISQTIDTTAGDCYIVQFDYNTNGASASDVTFTYQFGSNPVVNLPISPETPNAAGYTPWATETSGPLPGTGSDLLSFYTENNLASSALDQVSVVLAPNYIYDETQGKCVATAFCQSLHDDCVNGVAYVYACCQQYGGSNCASDQAVYTARCAQALTDSATCTTSTCCSTTFESDTGITTEEAVYMQSTCAGFNLQG